LGYEINRHLYPIETGVLIPQRSGYQPTAGRTEQANRYDDSTAQVQHDF